MFLKTIYAVIRNERVLETKYALEAIGIRGVTFLHVTGKGRQKGKVNPPAPVPFHRDNGQRINRLQDKLAETDSAGDFPGDPGEESAIELGFIPKRMLILVANDDDVDSIVDAIVSANKTGRHGDGKIFICPMISAICVRTGEQGDQALL